MVCQFTKYFRCLTFIFALSGLFCLTAAGQPRKASVGNANLTPVILIHGIGGADLTYRAPVKKDERGLIGNGFPNDVLKGFPGAPQNLQFDEKGVPRSNSISKEIKAIKFYDVPGSRNITDFSKFLKTKGYRKNENLFEFFYDFRYSVEQSSDELGVLIEQIISQTGASQIDIVAHSMGGLIAKNYLAKNPDAASKVKNLVFVGTPHLGAPKALKVLRYGDNLDVAAIDGCKLKRVAHNMPSIFNLLPGRRYFVAAGGGYFTDAADLDGDGVRATLDFEKTLFNLVNGRETRCLLNPRVDAPPFNNLSGYLVENQLVKFHDRLDEWQKPNGLKVFSIVGYGVPTIKMLSEDERQVSVTYTTAGDGTVPLISAEAVGSDETYFVNLAQMRSDHSQMIGEVVIGEQIYSLLQNNPKLSSGSLIKQRPTNAVFEESVKILP